jgi:hypothetical protein
MSVIGLVGAGIGLASSLFGAAKSAREAKKQEEELARQKASNEAWYNRNYYQDYLNTVEAQNALKRVRNAWAERTREARARQAITGGTAEQAQAVAEAGGEAMGETVGNLAARGQQNKAAIDAQKLAMDNNLSQQQMAINEARQTAASNLMSNGASMITSGLQAMDGGIKKAAVSPKVDVAPAGIPKQNVDIELPKTVENLSVPGGTAPAAGMIQPAAKTEVPNLVVAGRGKEAGIYPDHREEDEYYSKNKKYY